MKKSHDPFEEFPQDQVRSAIQSGIVQAKEQLDTPLRKNKGKRKIIYALCSVAAVFGILIGSLLLFTSACKQFVSNPDYRFDFREF